MVDDLFRRAVQTPEVIDEPLLIEWMEQAADGVRGDRAAARALRRAVRMSRKLARYWGDRDPSVLPDWRNGVDEALGGRGWQPQLDLVMASLAASPSPELFEEARSRNRAVHFTEWMEGVSYEQWLAERSS